jgi:hypothetical protein
LLWEVYGKDTLLRAYVFERYKLILDEAEDDE